MLNLEGCINSGNLPTFTLLRNFQVNFTPLNRFNYLFTCGISMILSMHQATYPYVRVFGAFFFGKGVEESSIIAIQVFSD
jgi:hypothetical protein